MEVSVLARAWTFLFPPPLFFNAFQRRGLLVLNTLPSTKIKAYAISTLRRLQRRFQREVFLDPRPQPHREGGVFVYTKASMNLGRYMDRAPASVLRTSGAGFICKSSVRRGVLD
jgi:hypothetical protein